MLRMLVGSGPVIFVLYFGESSWIIEIIFYELIRRRIVTLSRFFQLFPNFFFKFLKFLLFLFKIKKKSFEQRRVKFEKKMINFVCDYDKIESL